MNTSPLNLLRLLQSADSAFPSGAFAFSSGLERLARDGEVHGGADVLGVLEHQVVPRWLEFDRVFLNKAYAAADTPAVLLDLDFECHVQSGADRLAQASRRVGRSLLSVHTRMGTAHVAAYRAAIAEAGRGNCSGYEPVVQGVLGRGLALSPNEAEAGALHSVVMAFLSAAVRLGLIGAIDAQSLLADLLPSVGHALAAPVPERAGAFSPLAEIAAQRRLDDQVSLFAT